jgi:ribosomal protein S18 acetylase RimI-like enzyme
MGTRVRNLNIDQATSAAQLANVRELFLEYASSLEISLCFQNFEEELAGLPGKYAPPGGRLLLAHNAGQAVGCVALRPLSATECEMKRLYVRPIARGQHLGHTLASAVIKAACSIGYRCMRLDTLASMKPAISLYRSVGFREIPAYYANPSESAVFMELPLVQQAGTPVRTVQNIAQ